MNVTCQMRSCVVTVSKATINVYNTRCDTTKQDKSERLKRGSKHTEMGRYVSKRIFCVRPLRSPSCGCNVCFPVNKRKTIDCINTFFVRIVDIIYDAVLYNIYTRV